MANSAPVPNQRLLVSRYQQERRATKCSQHGPPRQVSLCRVSTMLGSCAESVASQKPAVPRHRARATPTGRIGLPKAPIPTGPIPRSAWIVGESRTAELRDGTSSQEKDLAPTLRHERVPTLSRVRCPMAQLREQLRQLQRLQHPRRNNQSSRARLFQRTFRRPARPNPPLETADLTRRVQPPALLSSHHPRLVRPSGRLHNQVPVTPSSAQTTRQPCLGRQPSQRQELPPRPAILSPPHRPIQ